jgi:hypothetical protein
MLYLLIGPSDNIVFPLFTYHLRQVLRKSAKKWKVLSRFPGARYPSQENIQMMMVKFMDAKSSPDS